MELDLSEFEQLVGRVYDLERRVRNNARASQGGQRSVEAIEGTTEFVDEFGVTRLTVGIQEDGTVTTVESNAPAPPVPTPPDVVPVAGGLSIVWDGTFEDENAPADYSHTEVHVYAESGDELDDSTQVTAWTSPLGGVYTYRTDALDAVTVALVAVNRSGTESERSLEVSASPLPISDFVSDGQVPPPVMQIEALAGFGAIYLRWTPVINNDPVSYQVHGSVEPDFAPGDENLLDVVSGATMTVRRLAGDETDTYNPVLALDTTYYFKVVSVDKDGPSALFSPEASSQLARATGDDIAVDTITARNILANTLTGDLFSSEVILGTKISTGSIDRDENSDTFGQIIGQRVELDPDGVRLVDASGVPVVSLPTDDDQPAIFKGQVETTSMRVLGGTSIESSNNEIAKDGSLMLSKGIAPPIVGPSLINVYESSRFDTTTKVAGPLGTFAFDPGQVLAFGYDQGWNCWLVSQKRSNGSRVWRFSYDGSLFLNPADGEPFIQDMEGWTITGVTSRPGSLAMDLLGKQGTQWWLLGSLYGDQNTRQYNKITVPNTGRNPTLTWDELLGHYMVADTQLNTDQVNIRRCRINAAYGATVAVLSSLNLADGSGRNGALASLMYGNFDIGGPRYLYTARGSYSTVWSYNGNSPYTVTPESAFPTPLAGTLGTHWNGTNFYTLGSDGTLFKHSNWTYTDDRDKLYVGVTLQDTDPAGTGTHETTLGAVTTLTRKKRASVQVTIPGIPDKGGTDDPDRWRMYAALSSNGAPPASAYHLQQAGVGATPATPSQVTLTAINEAGAAPPSVNGFPGANPARLYSADPGFEFRGDGTFALDPSKSDTDTDWVNPSLNAPFTTVDTVSYKRDASGRVELVGQVNMNSAASGSVLFTLPVGFRPTRQRRWLPDSVPATSSVRLTVETDGSVKINIREGTPTQAYVEGGFSTL